jgi:hypothetical protein
MAPERGSGYAGARMSDPAFRFVSAPSALLGGPAGWASEMLRDGEVALLAGSAITEVSQVAHDLKQPVIQVIRGEADPAAQDATVIDYGENLPLIWVAPSFRDDTRHWARERGPMTLLVEADQPLADEQRRTIDRFVATLGRQSE